MTSIQTLVTTANAMVLEGKRNRMQEVRLKSYSKAAVRYKGAIDTILVTKTQYWKYLSIFVAYARLLEYTRNTYKLHELGALLQGTVFEENDYLLEIVENY